MSKTWSTMDVGKRAMLNSKAALHTVSHNIANKNTEGYSVQRVDTEANAPVTEGRLQFGTGARMQGVSRNNNPFIEKKIEQEMNRLGEIKAKGETLAQIENIFNEQVNKGLNKFMIDFFNAFRELSQNPEDLAVRTRVLESSQAMISDFKRVSGQLNDISGGIDNQIRIRINQVNDYAKEIAQLNEQIARTEVSGAQANDQRDKRDVVLKKLGELIDIKYGEDRVGQLTITAANTVVLVTGNTAQKLGAYSGPSDKESIGGKVDIYFEKENGFPPQKMTHLIRGGELYGLIQSRDQGVGSFSKRIDEMAYSLAEKVNEIHFQGFNLYDKQNQLFFDIPNGIEGAAQNLKINSMFEQDVGLIAASSEVFSPGNNQVANLVSLLQFEKSMGSGKATFDEFYSAIVAETGTEAQRALSALGSQEDSLKQLKNLRESISGVSLDEETAKMIEYQKMFDASARIIRTVDEMMDTVLKLKPV